MNKVVIVGCGNVGMSYAYALVSNGANVDELVLIDLNNEKAEGEALDLNHALSYAPRSMKIKAGSYSDCSDADIICICAGRNQEVGETRNDLISKNYAVFKSIIGEVNKTRFHGIYLIATNPLDIMTYVTHKLSTTPTSQIIGSGTTLDTARLRFLIAKKLDINPKNVHAYVIGEHGDSEFIPWNNASVGYKSIDEYLTDIDKEKIAYEVKNSAYDIIKKKGSTCYGIGVCLLKITQAIFNNENSILTVSTYNEEHDIYFSKPAIVNKNGIRESLFIELTKEDEQLLLNSINELKKVKKLLK